MASRHPDMSFIKSSQEGCSEYRVGEACHEIDRQDVRMLFPLWLVLGWLSEIEKYRIQDMKLSTSPTTKFWLRSHQATIKKFLSSGSCRLSVCTGCCACRSSMVWVRFVGSGVGCGDLWRSSWSDRSVITTSVFQGDR